FLLFIYGGAPYQTQESKLRRGVDIVVGTPGRVKDHIERKNIDLSQLKFHVLDEANEMLRMGFVEDARYKMLAKFRHFFSVLLCQIGLS
ncbi:hypothetical protein HN873_004279, partial [Arachis hypogaea]